MIINQANLSGIYTAMNTIFNAAFTGAATFYQKLAMVVPSSTRANDYKFMLQFPMLQEWLGDRQIKSLAASNWSITNKDYEASLEIDRNDIADDQLGIFNPIVSELGRAAAQHPDLLIKDLLVGGFDTACYDGEYFFDTDHVVAGASYSNTGGGAAAPWFLLDTTRMIKPFIFQQRTTPALTRQDRQEDENVFIRKKFRYGVDYRGAAGYGLWQLAYGSKTALTVSLYETARTAMMGLTNDEGVPLGITPNLLVVPPVYGRIAREICEATDVIGDGTAGGSKTNVWKGTATVLELPWLPNS